MTPLLVMHDVGAEGAARWRAAFATAWAGDVIAPDLPGHGAAPAPVGGNYELGDAVFAVADHLPGPDDRQPLVLGAGRNGHAAQVLALAGRASGLVLVDGLGGPWLDVRERNAELRAMRRALLATPAALDPHVPGTTDPRTTFVVGPRDRGHALGVLADLPVPTLVVETPSSPTPDARDLVDVIPHGELLRLPSADPSVVAGPVVDWWSASVA